NILLDIDQIYDENEFKQIIGEQMPSPSDGPERPGLTRLDNYFKLTATARGDVKYRPRGAQTLLDDGSNLDFTRGDTDLRRKRKTRSDGQQL
ncbi:MAG: hypothetical protein QXI32_05940, partial [Candidatus Bathyarchaeia archaeon]